MRVITGTARGVRLEPPEGTDTRPTSELVKEAVMSMVQFEMEGSIFLDMFAGCGQMGIEALSRGARRCIFIDNARKSCELVRRNLTRAKLSDRAQVVMADSLSWLRTAAGPVDIAYVDPPYGQGIAKGALSALAEIMSESGVILVETDYRDELPREAGEFSLAKEYRYGKIKISKYLRSGQEDEAPAEALQ